MEAIEEKKESLYREEVLGFEIFSGQPLPKLADYNRIMRCVKERGINSALLEYGLSIEDYINITSRWFNRLTRDEFLSKVFRDEMSIR